MGTNYYVKTETCPTCGHKPDGIHLGKSSGGWKFIFAYNGGQYYKSYEEMRKWLADKSIENEYGEEVSHLKFWDMVREKQKEQSDWGKRVDTDLLIIDGYEFYDRDFS